MLPESQQLDSDRDALLRSRMRTSQNGYMARKLVRPTKPKLFADITSHLNKPNTPSETENNIPSNHLPLSDISKPNLNQKTQTAPAISNNIPKNDKYIAPRLKPTTNLIRTSHTNVLNRTAVGVRPDSKGKMINLGFHKLNPKLVIVAVILVFLFGLYASLTGFKPDHVAKVQAAKTQTSAPTVSIVKPTAADIANYTVTSSLPRYIQIPSIGVDARTLSVGMTFDGSVASPNNVFDAGWDNQSSVPGQLGAMVIDGYVSYATTNGVFSNINKLAAGDFIKVVSGGGTIFTYSVVKTQVYPSGNVNMVTATEPITPGTPGLNLITYGSEANSGTNQSSERTVVYASLQ